jgi:hypothetical protein
MQYMALLASGIASRCLAKSCVLLFDVGCGVRCVLGYMLLMPKMPWGFGQKLLRASLAASCIY